MSRFEKLQKMLAADPGDTFVLYALAQEHARQGRHGEAIAYFDRTLGVDPAYCYAYFHKAKSQQAMANLAAARATVQAGIDAAHRAGDAKALNELSSLATDLSEG